MIALFLIAVCVFCVSLPRRGSFVRSGRVFNEEWTEFDEEGTPVRGVGYRGYWVNHSVDDGSWPFRKCKCGTDCSGWVSKETGIHAKVMSLNEALAEFEHAPDGMEN